VQNVLDTVFLKALGNRVREIRKQKKLTQEDLGFAIGNSGKQIGRIERGEHNVTSCMLYKLSLALNVNIKELFDFEIKKQSKIKN
jgi:transcriptional regulator with XRE-family HTH domain